MSHITTTLHNFYSRNTHTGTHAGATQANSGSLRSPSIIGIALRASALLTPTGSCLRASMEKARDVVLSLSQTTHRPFLRQTNHITLFILKPSSPCFLVRSPNDSGECIHTHPRLKSGVRSYIRHLYCMSTIYSRDIVYTNGIVYRLAGRAYGLQRKNRYRPTGFCSFNA